MCISGEGSFESTQGSVCQQLIRKILKEADNLGGGLPPNQVVPMPEHQDSTHTHTVVGCVVVLINALCQQCVCVWRSLSYGGT